jgi:hypothetical protein
MSSAESPPMTACTSRLARWLALFDRSLTVTVSFVMSSENGGWVEWSRKRT